MSKSILRDKYMREQYKGVSFVAKRMHLKVRNSHRQDEMPKNCPSRLVLNNCSADVEWLENSTSFGGHSRPKGGHRRVSGLVRASLKMKMLRMIDKELEEKE